MNARIGGLTLLLALSLLWAFPSYSYDDSSLLTAAERVAAGRGSPADEALLFMENRRVNHLAMEGKLDGSVYQRTQSLYDERNRALAEEAARKVGFSTEGGVKKAYKPGTDTDVSMTGKDLTAADVERARKAYNKGVEAYLRESGVKAERGVNWAARTETDIMPSPSRMKSEAEFAKAAALINGDGGNMYVSPLAAGAQAKLDGGDPVSVAEGQAYVEEMKAKIESMKRAKTDLVERYRRAETPLERDSLAAEIRKSESHEAKYIDRINRLERSLSGGLGASTAILETAGARAPGAANRRAEVAVDAMSGHLTEKALRNYAETLGDLAVSSTSPKRRAALKDAMAATLKGLPPARQGDALAGIESRLGGGFAKEIAAEMKKPMAGVKATSPGTSLLKGAGVVSTVLAGYNAVAEENRRTSGNPNYGRAALNFAYDMTIRGAVDAAGRDTAEFTERQVEELKEYYRSRGEDPESLATKMKILAEASLKGTAYGTVKGVYELAKASGKWTGGAIVGGAETVIFLAGEALDTLNTLEVGGANLREQGMAQEVQDAKSVRSGRDLVFELRRMAALAASQRSILEQNFRWARSIDVHRSRSLDALRSRIEGLSQAFDLSDAEQKVAERLKLYPPEFKRIAEYSAVIYSKIKVVEKAIKGGKSAIEVAADVRFIVAEHDRNIEGFNVLVEGMKEIRRMDSIGDVGQILASLEDEKKLLLALGDEAENGATVIKRNYETWRRAVLEYERIKSSLARGYSYFYGKKGVPGWLTIKSDADSVVAPDRTIPENGGAEVATLQRMKASIESDLKRLPKIDDEQRLRATMETIKKGYNSLLPGYEAARASLEKTNLALERLIALLGTDPVPPAPDSEEEEDKESPPPAPEGGKALGLTVPLGLNDLLLEKTGLSAVAEGVRKQRDDVENGYYLTEEILNNDFLIVFLTPDNKEVKVSLKGAKALPDPGSNRFFALAGTIAYSKKKSVIGYYLDFKNNRLERSPGTVYEGGMVMNYSVLDAKTTDDRAGTLAFHSARFGLEKGMSQETIKGMGVTVLEASGFRMSKRGSGDVGTIVYGAVVGDFVVNVSFTRHSLRPDNWSPPSFDADKVVLALLQQLF